jgi:uncharacterized metal-binding protein
MKYTDNVRFSHKLNLIVLVLAFALFGLILGQDFYQSIIRAMIFVFLYAFASAFIQPDLDQSVSRPGRTTFPLGQFKNTNLGENLFNILYPLNRIWYYFWHPYGLLLTHRGISHWPILGTLTRAGYILGIAWGLGHFLPFVHFGFIIDYLKLYFPTEYNRTHFAALSIFWFSFVCPFFVSDVVHFLIDFFDSIRNNTRFGSYAHEPGALKQILNPKIMKFHKRALKKAKSNAKKRKKL